MAHPMVTAPAVVARQVNPTGIYGCTNYNFNAVESCVNNVLDQAFPSCYDYYSDQGCCTQWMSWYVSDFNCLQTAYSDCFDFTDYLSGISELLPCYSNNVFTSTLKKPNNSPATTTPIPQLQFQSITYGTPTPTPQHAAITKYTGTGDLLQGYCNTPKYVMLDGPTAYWAPVVGCADDKTDCCPFQARQSTTGTTAVTVVSTVTVDVGPGGVGTAYTGLFGYPQASDTHDATLKHCPEDYVTIRGGCCPSGYQLWNVAVGGAVPCYSSLMNTISDVPVVPIPGVATAAATTDTGGDQLTTSSKSSSSYSPTDSKPTSAIVNVVYAFQYPVEQKSGLSTGAKAGIGAGVGATGLVAIVLGLLLIRKYRHSNKQKQTIAALSTAGASSQRESQAAMSSASPYAYSTRTELHSDGIQSPNSAFGATPQTGAMHNGYFPPPGQSPHPVDPYTGMLMAPGQQIQRRPVPGQEIQYSPPPPTVSPAAGSDAHSFQTGYSGPPVPQWSPANQTGGYQPPQQMGGGQIMQPQQTQYYLPPQEMSGQAPAYEVPNSQQRP